MLICLSLFCLCIALGKGYPTEEVCSISDLLGSSSQSRTLVGLEALSLDHDVVQAAAGGGRGRDGVVVVAGDGGGGHHLLKNVTPNCRIDTS